MPKVLGGPEFETVSSLLEGAMAAQMEVLHQGRFQGLALCQDSSISFEIESTETRFEGFEPSNEAYELTVSESGQIAVSAKTYIGGIRGLQTLSQLFERSESGLQLSSLPLTIKDEPAFGYRGFLLDISREFFPVETIQKVIYGMAQAKLSVLHLHISDDDSMPLNIPSYPDLARNAAWSEDEIYEPEDMK